MAGYDGYVTDPAADDADRRLAVCPACRSGECEFCDGECDCDHDDARERAQREN